MGAQIILVIGISSSTEFLEIRSEEPLYHTSQSGVYGNIAELYRKLNQGIDLIGWPI